MQFYVQMRWNIAGRLSFDEVWDLQVKEAATIGQPGVKSMYKVAGQQRVIAICEFEDADELDRTFMARLPLREYIELEAIWALRPFESFVADCATHFAG